MSAYSEQVLSEKLAKMNNTQQSIQTLSHWIMYHRKRYIQSVEVWENELIKASPDRKLVFIFLANDIMQNSRKRGPEFIKEFAKCIKRLVATVYRQGNHDDRKNIDRILEVWDQRTVFPTAFIEEIRRACRDESIPLTTAPETTNVAPVKVPSSPLPINTTPKLPELLQSPASLKNGMANRITEAIRKVEEAAISNDLASEGTALLRPELLDGSAFKSVATTQEYVSLATEFDEAYKLLQEQKKNMEEGISRRTELIALLSQYLGKQEEELIKSNEVLKMYAQQLQTAETTRGVVNMVSSNMKTSQQEVPDGMPSLEGDDTNPPLKNKRRKREETPKSASTTQSAASTSSLPSNEDGAGSSSGYSLPGINSSSWNPIPLYK
eukprot:TRINITY_DN9567_c0_g1_i1.p1 TRINITY_DN9567_c0_g1~~TRINITY_DN9567_c0_g1_i1.p1  ORF type:complete len:381 (-),score=77.00 TRINITY_DN9567_c0_g1_i1:8-1150(-)